MSKSYVLRLFLKDPAEQPAAGTPPTGKSDRMGHFFEGLLSKAAAEQPAVGTPPTGKSDNIGQNGTLF